MKVLLLLLLTLPVFAETLSLDQADGIRLYYYLDAPASLRGDQGGLPSPPGPPLLYPLVVILQGSECRRVSDKYASFIEYLCKHNVAVLRVESRV